MTSIIFFTVAAAAPETVVGGGAVSGFAVSGVNGIPVGYLAIALMAVLSYSVLQVSLVGGFGVGASDFVRQSSGVEMPWWVCAGAGVLVVAGLGVLRIDVNGLVLGVLLIAEVAVILLFDWAFVSAPSEAGWCWTRSVPHNWPPAPPV